MLDRNFECDDETLVCHLSLLQVVLMKLIRDNPENAFGFALTERVSEHRVIDGAQTYTALYRLEKRGLLAPTRHQRKRIGKGGRPIKLYEVTEKGVAAIRVAEALLGIKMESKP